jgi:hypothetical protein
MLKREIVIEFELANDSAEPGRMSAGKQYPDLVVGGRCSSAVSDECWFLLVEESGNAQLQLWIQPVKRARPSSRPSTPSRLSIGEEPFETCVSLAEAQQRYAELFQQGRLEEAATAARWFTMP